MNGNVICVCRQQCQQRSRSNKVNLDVSNGMAPLNTSSIDLERVSTPQNGLSLLRFEPELLENINSMFGREKDIAPIIAIARISQMMHQNHWGLCAKMCISHCGE